MSVPAETRCPETDAWGWRCDLETGHPGFHLVTELDGRTYAFGTTTKTPPASSPGQETRRA